MRDKNKKKGEERGNAWMQGITYDNDANAIDVVISGEERMAKEMAMKMIEGKKEKNKRKM